MWLPSHPGLTTTNPFGMWFWRVMLMVGGGVNYAIYWLYISCSNGNMQSPHHRTRCWLYQTIIPQHAQCSMVRIRSTMLHMVNKHAQHCLLAPRCILIDRINASSYFSLWLWYIFICLMILKHCPNSNYRAWERADQCCKVVNWWTWRWQSSMLWCGDVFLSRRMYKIIMHLQMHNLVHAKGICRRIPTFEF